MSGGLRIRRRRRLASALRWCAAQESAVPAAALAPLAEQLEAMGEAAAGADLPERLARLDHGGAAPPEVVAMLAAILHPLINLPSRSSDP
jgi:hypothetical protein